MGWNSWNCWGNTVSHEKVMASAKAILESGLADYGWSYINIDDGFQGGRGKDGNLKINLHRFPKGLKPVADYIHSLGRLAGSPRRKGKRHPAEP